MSSISRDNAWDLIIRVDSEFDYNKCALVVIDLQYLTASRECGAFKKVTDGGFGAEGEYAISRLEQTVVPNVARLAKAMRAKNLPVIFARVGSLKGDGSDQTERHRKQGLTVALDERPAQILEGLGVEKTDLIITKSGSGCFTSTNLDHMLRNMGIRDVILTGIWTNSCVETTARHAGDLDYRAVIVEDCCAAMTEKLHTHALEYMDNNWGVVRSTDEVVASLSAAKGS
jgi:ureidoacrylate peracid hydrolase